jgi:Uma2 family endonuclease
MAQATIQTEQAETQTTLSILEQYGIEPPDISQIEIEDGAPVDSVFSEREMRLLTETLYASWKERPFVAAANVGVFYAIQQPPYVPDVFVSLEVTPPGHLRTKQSKTYMAWEYGKLPDVIIEIVSNKKGGELDEKKRAYAFLRIPYYIVHDPAFELGKQELYVFELQRGVYVELNDGWLPQIGLGVRLWEGEYEGWQERWLRWCDINGELLPTGAEAAQEAQSAAEIARQRAQSEFDRAEDALERIVEERQRAEEAYQIAEQERQRADRLAAKLRALGIDPD